ncbi:hypothetical protein EW146_g8694 [Bondarzewia mesenterica]|uniref:BCAS3 WD40 domain-containing protein n=1 Tax=Bondarzewia mesenterica TaxID=1095465 RepID=A0A4S4LCT9_9AGAM|nr:hypothetical protein EW146_g8694 [Bondarzewia mesenterica]
MQRAVTLRDNRSKASHDETYRSRNVIKLSLHILFYSLTFNLDIYLVFLLQDLQRLIYSSIVHPHSVLELYLGSLSPSLMPSRSNHNASRNHNAKSSSPHSLLSQFDDTVPQTPPMPPLVDLDSGPPDSEPELEIERVGQLGTEQALGFYVPVEDSQQTNIMPPPSPAVPESDALEESGHVRVPILARQSTRLENISRTMRNYVPSSISIPIPSAAPSPPRVSRPVSFGSFMSPSGQTDRRRGSAGTEHRQPWSADQSTGDGDIFSLDEQGGDEHIGGGRARVRYPGVNDADEIRWSKWDSLPADDRSKARRLLLLGYQSGFQIWDCTSLESIVDLLNLPRTDWGRILSASILPSPPSAQLDQFADSRPLLGIIAKHHRHDPELIIYSLSCHDVIKRRSFPGLVSFSSNANFIIISTSNPTALRILSICTLNTLYIIPSSSLSTFTFRAPLINSNNNTMDTTVLLPDSLDPDQAWTDQPQTAFALSHRLLAYASPPPRPDSPTSTPSSTQPRARTPARGDSASGFAQADIGNMALRVGGNVLSGLWSLGEVAYSAARTRVSGDRQVQHPVSPTSGPTSGITGMFFSRSAPTASHSRERRYSQASSGGVSDTGAGRPVIDLNDEPQSVPSCNVPHSAPLISPSDKAKGFFVTILDLSQLLPSPSSATPAQPSVIAEFMVSKRHSVSLLRFSSDGGSLMVVPEDGQTIKVFQVRPVPKLLRALGQDSGGDEVIHSSSILVSVEVCQTLGCSDPGPSLKDGGAPWHMYDLRRGRTSAIVEDVDWASDGRWIAIGSRNRTVHIFATNPYGGKADEQSHLIGRVLNSTELVRSFFLFLFNIMEVDQILRQHPLSTTVSPIVRLRAPRASVVDQTPARLTFMFIKSDPESLPHRLFPAPIAQSSPPSPTSARSSPSRTSEPLLPTNRTRRPTNYQDVLIFDQADGTLSLRRFFVDLRLNDNNITVLGSVPGLGGTSISLPTRTSFNWMSVSSPTAPSGNTSGISKMMEKRTELIGREVDVATWNLRRGYDWPELKRRLTYDGPVAGQMLPQRTTKYGTFRFSLKL